MHIEKIKRAGGTKGLPAASLSLLLLSGAWLAPAPAHGQGDGQDAVAVTRYYVSPRGNDLSSGRSPEAAAADGPFQTADRARQALGAETESGLGQPVEVVFDAGAYGYDTFLTGGLLSEADAPAVWHYEPSRSFVVLTRTLGEMAQVVRAEDGWGASSGGRVLRLFVSPDGDDAASGHLAAGGGADGPLRTLGQAQRAVNALEAGGVAEPVEVVLEPASGLTGAAASVDAASGRPSPKPAKRAAAPKTVPAARKATLAAHATRTGGVHTGALARAVSPKLVFAHYMMAIAGYSTDPGGAGTVAGYEHDIQDAQAAGIDGFALNIGWWSGANYKHDTACMFQAAHTLGTGFKLFFSADEGNNDLTTTGFPASDIVNMIQTYGNDPSYFHYLGRPVLSTWGGEGNSAASALDFWQNQVLTPLRKSGYNTYFVPQFCAKYYASNWAAIYPNPTPQQISDGYNLWWNQVVDGLFQVSLGPPASAANLTASSLSLASTSPTNSGLAAQDVYAKLMQQNAKTFMSSVSPQYWGDIQGGSRNYSEYDGGEGLAAQWNSIISVQKSAWVELFTWNDFDESTYFSPNVDVVKYWPFTGHRTTGFYKSHAGALALTKYYIQWYKTGTKPALPKDNLYFFYRTQPMNMVATNDSRGPVTGRAGDIQDDIYVTAILPSAATLQVTSGSTQQTFHLPAGNSNIRVPFSVGSQTFTLSRNGKTLLTQQGEPIVGSAPEYNFNYYTVTASD